MKGMLVSIFRNAEGSDCTNGGVSSRATRAILVGQDIPEIFEARGGEPVLLLVRRNIAGRPYFHAQPIDPPAPGPGGAVRNGWMFGGNFIHTSDSRFGAATGGHGYPIAIHDRAETPSDY